MTKTIWKFNIDVRDSQRVILPSQSELLSVATQDGHICIWALVDPRQPNCEREIVMRGTGHTAEGLKGRDFIGTVLIANDSLVFHVFDGGWVA